MKRKRSRPETEQRFQKTVLELVADSGCAELGVNLVAQRTGSDKVLIYRYFGSMDGLLEATASSRRWLPEPSDLFSKINGEATQIVRSLFRELTQHLRADQTSLKLMQWRHAVENPLTERITKEWQELWSELESALSAKSSASERKVWKRICQLLALLVQSDLAGEHVGIEVLDELAAGLETTGDFVEEAIEEDVLPTNLL